MTAIERTLLWSEDAETFGFIPLAAFNYDRRLTFSRLRE
jgi:hypothetical protein